PGRPATRALLPITRGSRRTVINRDSCARPSRDGCTRRMAMNTTRVACALVASVIVLSSGVRGADAHGFIGKCFLPATLAIDDPFVADELSFPTVSHIKTPASSDSSATKETELSAP